MAEAPADLPVGPQYGALPAWNQQTRRPAQPLTNQPRQAQDAWNTSLAGAYTPDRSAVGFTQFTQGNQQIPRVGQRSADNSTHIAMAGLAKRNTIDRNLISQQGLQKVNTRRYKQWSNSSYAHNKPFSPYEGQFDNDAGSRLNGHYVVWAESNGERGYQDGEKVIAVDGYKMKRLPNSQILAGFINEQRAHPEAKVDFKQYVKWARDQQYEAKHGVPRQKSSIATIGSITGEFYRTALDQIAPYQVVGEGKNAKPKRIIAQGPKAGQPLPRGLFAEVNAEMYDNVSQAVFQNVFHSQPLAPTKENQKAFSRAVAESAPSVITQQMVTDAILDHLK
jgi:hypothetical protein